MVVLVLTACPPGLRGYLTRWMLEISAGVFVGTVSTRVRELMWKRTIEMVRSGRAIMVFSARNEQRLSFLVHGHHWEPVDVDGITLMLRPHADLTRRRVAPRTSHRVEQRRTPSARIAARRSADGTGLAVRSLPRLCEEKKNPAHEGPGALYP